MFKSNNKTITNSIKMTKEIKITVTIGSIQQYCLFRLYHNQFIPALISGIFFQILISLRDPRK
jgi:hypothetical protein